MLLAQLIAAVDNCHAVSDHNKLSACISGVRGQNVRWNASLRYDRISYSQVSTTNRSRDIFMPQNCSKSLENNLKCLGVPSGCVKNYSLKDVFTSKTHSFRHFCKNDVENFVIFIDGDHFSTRLCVQLSNDIWRCVIYRTHDSRKYQCQISWSIWMYKRNKKTVTINESYQT